MDFIYSILQSIGFNWHVALANFINFLIILFILNKYVFKKMVNLVTERDGMIRDGLSNAQNAEKTLAAAKETGESIITDSKNAANKIISDSTSKAEALARDIESRAQSDIEALKKNLNDKTSRVQSEVEAEFQKHSPALLANLLKKTLASNVNGNNHDEFVNILLQKKSS
jgi:F-type H+-transporting ATPase subunit b